MVKIEEDKGLLTQVENDVLMTKTTNLPALFFIEFNE